MDNITPTEMITSKVNAKTIPITSNEQYRSLFSMNDAYLDLQGSIIDVISYEDDEHVEYENYIDDLTCLIENINKLTDIGEAKSYFTIPKYRRLFRKVTRQFITNAGDDFSKLLINLRVSAKRLRHILVRDTPHRKYKNIILHRIPNPHRNNEEFADIYDTLTQTFSKITDVVVTQPWYRDITPAGHPTIEEMTQEVIEDIITTEREVGALNLYRLKGVRIIVKGKTTELFVRYATDSAKALSYYESILYRVLEHRNAEEIQIKADVLNILTEQDADISSSQSLILTKEKIDHMVRTASIFLRPRLLRKLNLS